MSLYVSRDASIPSAEQLTHHEEERHSPELKYDEMEMIAVSPDADFLSRCSDGSESMPLPVRIWPVVQKPGGLLVIPVFWWYQTYTLEPLVGIAS